MSCERVCVPCDGGEADLDADDDADDDKSPSETNCVLMKSEL